VTLILIVPALLLMVLFVAEGAQAAGNLQDAIAAGRFHWINRVWGWLTERSGATGSDLPALLRDSAAQIGTFLAAQLGTVVRNIAIFLFELFVTLFALFYFIRDGEAIVNGLLDALPFDRAICDQILMEARQLIHATVRVGLFLALLQGLVGGLAFAIVRIPTPLFWGMAMAFLALLPVVGTWPIWLPAVVWLYAAGHGVRATLLLIICAVMVGAVDYFLRPALLSGDARLNGLLVFIGVLGGVAAFGMLGVVLGPLVLATAMSVWDVYARRERRAAGPEALLS
jgi:predicted PurR-regulated permease PerM